MMVLFGSEPIAVEPVFPETETVLDSVITPNAIDKAFPSIPLEN